MLSGVARPRVVTRISVDAVLAILVFTYWVAFENALFVYSMDVGGPVFFVFVNAIKLVLPFGLLAFIGFPPVRLLTRGPVSIYLALFVVFMVWALVPTVVAGDAWVWLKFTARLAFFVSAVALWSKRPAAFAVFAKCLILYVLLALAQFVLLYITGSYNSAAPLANGYFAGPFGLLGNIAGRFGFPGVSVPFVRLAGFWNEPTHAAACAYAGYFLGRHLVATGERPIWGTASKGCLIAGILTLSNAGYFALGVALSIGLVLGGSRLTTRRLLQFAMMLPVVGLLLFTTFGRGYFSERAAGNIWVLALTGVRTASAIEDPSGGRLDQFKATVESTKANWAGVGVQDVGVGGIPSSSSAPLYWLLLTGVPGIILLLGREATLVAAAWTLAKRRPEDLGLVQALVTVMVQHLSYGTWMDPNYFVLASMVLVCSSASKTINVTGSDALASGTS
jgi:hypothetical protein